MQKQKNSAPRFAWPALNPGSLRNQVTLARASTGQDASGQPLTTWPVYLTIWAAIRNLSGQELFQGDEFTSAAQVRITTRWPGPGVDIQPGDRAVCGSHTYVVQIIDNVELRDIVLNLQCLEINGAS